MRAFFAAFLLLLWTGAVVAQTLSPRRLGPGTFLVSPRRSPDPNFSETVVLLVRYGEDGAMGLVINRPMKLTMSKLFPEHSAEKAKDGAVYSGGPVMRNGALALIRSKTRLENAQHVLGDVYMISDRAFFDKSVAANLPATTFRVYLGYSGWARDQLENELDHQLWHVMPGELSSVFDTEPESLWPRLVRRTELQVAQAIKTRP